MYNARIMRSHAVYIATVNIYKKMFNKSTTVFNVLNIVFYSLFNCFIKIFAL